MRLNTFHIWIIKCMFINYHNRQQNKLLVTCFARSVPKYQNYSASRQVFVNNVMRIKAIIMEFVELAKQFENLLEWESPALTITAFIVYIVSCYYCEPFWIPIALLLVFVRNYMVLSYSGRKGHSNPEHDVDHEDTASLDLENEGDEGHDDNAEKSEEKMTFKVGYCLMMLTIFKVCTDVHKIKHLPYSFFQRHF